jgi:hypothetical protein
LERFDGEVAKVKKELAGFEPKKWDENWKFVAGGQAWIDESKYEVWRSWVLNHMIHHRAQMGFICACSISRFPERMGLRRTSIDKSRD